jgi:DNA repair protein RecO (recombination protein O)
VTAGFVTTPAVVLKSSHYSETSGLVSAFTRKLGKSRFLAKGARRPKSPFAGLLEPLSRVELVLIPGRSGLHTLKECSPLGEASGLRDELGRLSAALLALALVDETQVDDDPQPGVFELLDETLERLETSRNAAALLFAFQLRLIELSGYGLDLATCAADGSPLRGGAFFSPSHQGFLCSACRSGVRGRAVSPGAFSALRRLDQASPAQAERIRLSAAQTTELARLFDVILETFLEKKLAVTSIIRKLATAGAPAQRARKPSR